MSQEYDRLADDLEAFLAARQASEGAASAMTVADAGGAQSGDLSVAGALLDLAARLAPDPTFADELEARILAAAERTSSAPPAAGGPATRRNGGGLAPTVRRWLPQRNGEHEGRDEEHRRDGRWPLWGSIAALFLIAVLVLVPPVQAALRSILHIGEVTIVRTAPTPAPHASPTPTLLPSLLDLAGQTTLAQAQSQATFPIVLPAYPPDLGPPDHVFLQDLDGPMVVLVWTVPGHPDQVRMSLHEIGSGIPIFKIAPPAIQMTTVHGQQALWTDGPYQVQVQTGGGQVQTVMRRLVTAGHVLLWTDGSVTYRLETGLSLSEAVRIAESLH